MLYKIAAVIGIILLILIALLTILYFLSKRLYRLPVRFFWDLKDTPAIPLQIAESASTLLSLNSRKKEANQAMTGCTHEYAVRINGEEKNVTAYNLMFGFGEQYKADRKNGEDIQSRQEITPAQLAIQLGKSFFTGRVSSLLGGEQDLVINAGDMDKITQTTLTEPEQFGMSWTSANNLYNRNVEKGYLKRFSETITDADKATEAFWPMISEYGMAYNLVIAQKVTKENKADVYKHIDKHWFAELDEMIETEELYVIDFMFFKFLEPQKPEGKTERFTPATLTLLRQDKKSKNLIPFAIWVNGWKKGDRSSEGQFYNRLKKNCTDSTWLYALQATKVSMTVHGIWFGHVYSWHIVSAAMQLALYKVFPKTHPIYKILEPHSHYLIPFDDILLVMWKAIAPPTSIITGKQFLEAVDKYAHNRSFFEDDPKFRVEKLGLKEKDFTSEGVPWDKYKVVGRTLEIWNSVEFYIKQFVTAFYDTDDKIKNDKHLQKWIKYASNAKGGNINGLPSTIEDQDTLINILTSVLYRVVVHGNSRLDRAANPALSFLANFPPCLQDARIPKPTEELYLEDILSYLPRTGSIGEMNNFYFTFIYSSPYESFIPIDGVDADLPFKHEKAKARGGEEEREMIGRYEQKELDYSIYYIEPDTNPKEDPEAYVNEAMMLLRKRLEVFINYYDEGSPLINQWPKNIET